MAAFNCPEPCVVCPVTGTSPNPNDVNDPFINLSISREDVDSFIGRRYNPYKPPLGSTWYSLGCVGWCVSDTSQAEADLCAAQQAVICLQTEWPQNNENGEEPLLVPRETFTNFAQSCSFPCPDGSFSTFIVRAGAFTAFNQATADAQAYSYACNKAVENRLCFGSLTPSRACLDEVYSGSIGVATAFLPVTLVIIAGALPEGIMFAQNPSTALFSGVPTTAGDYAFTLQATDSVGNIKTASFTLSVAGIANDSPLPVGAVAVGYSEILTTIGTIPGTPTWSVTAGSLPPGLSLNASTGEISGIPSLAGTYNFTIGVTDS